MPTALFDKLLLLQLLSVLFRGAASESAGGSPRSSRTSALASGLVSIKVILIKIHAVMGAK